MLHFRGDALLYAGIRCGAFPHRRHGRVACVQTEAPKTTDGVASHADHAGRGWRPMRGFCASIDYPTTPASNEWNVRNTFLDMHRMGHCIMGHGALMWS